MSTASSMAWCILVTKRCQALRRAASSIWIGASWLQNDAIYVTSTSNTNTVCDYSLTVLIPLCLCLSICLIVLFFEGMKMKKSTHFSGTVLFFVFVYPLPELRCLL